MRCRVAAVALLLLFLLAATTTAAASDGNAASQVAALQQQVLELSQLLSQVVGADPVVGQADSGALLPGTSITQRLIARQPELWPQHFTFLSAVAADSSVTCSTVLTDKAKRAGHAQYVVLADQAGRLYFFTPQGALLFEHDTGVSSSSVTSLSSELVRKNETQLLVGQADGTITVLSVAHQHSRHCDGTGIRAVVPLMVSTAADRAAQHNDTDEDSHAVPIRHITFGMASARRMLLAVDASGRVLLLASTSGRLLMVQQTTSGPPLAIHLNNNFQLIVQGEAATSILLMKRGRSRVTRSCAGLTPHPQSLQPDSPQQQHGDRLVAAVFDPQRPFRLFGVTSGGDLVAMVVPSGMAAHTCKVLQRVPLGLPPGPVHLVMGKGTLILLHSAGAAAFSLSLHKVQLAGSHLVSHTWQQLWRVYGLGQQYQQHMPQQQQPQQPSADSDAIDTSPAGEGVLHQTGWDSPLAAAAATADLLLLPFGSTGMASFAVGGAGRAPLGGLSSSAAGKRQSSRGSSSSSGGGGGGGGSDANWAKAIQPFVVIMMIIVGVWQFVRASNRSGLAGARGRGGYAGAGGSMAALAALGGGSHQPYLSRAQGMAAAFAMPGEQQQRRPAWALGEEGGEDYSDLLAGISSSSYERDLGPYAGPRSSRRDGAGGREQLGAGLGLTARRRARAAMFTSRHSEREQAERERLAVQQQQQQRRRGQAVTAAAGGSTAAAGSSGSGMRAEEAAAADAGRAGAQQEARRVTFEDEALHAEQEEEEDEAFLTEAEQQLLFQRLEQQQQQQQQQQEGPAKEAAGLQQQQLEQGDSQESSEAAAAGVNAGGGWSSPPAVSAATDSGAEGASVDAPSPTGSS